ncbi:MAG: orotidine-5'-phosphate decarboxylase [Chloroflexi bacterium]|nr:orotidine-5'-phosphate decarboxylase [Chloroflexota bacterium]
MSFIEKLHTAQQQRDSWLCIGLDPTADQIPSNLDVLTFSKRIVDATLDYVCAYKPSLAFYLAWGPDGIHALQEVIAYIPPEIPVILDAKFGDIDYAAGHYARAAFEMLGADAVTVSPYVGMDAVTPLLRYEGKMVFVLVRSANTTGNDFQLWPNDSSPLFRYVTAQLNTLADKYPDQIGLGVAATQARDLGRIRCWAPSLPFLIPGLGAQGGDLNTSVEQGLSRDGTGPLLSVTRSIIYASTGDDFAEAARQAAHDWSQRIRLTRAGHPTPSGQER